MREIKRRMHERKLEVEKNVPSSPTERAYEIAVGLLILFINFCVSRGDVDALFPSTVPPSPPKLPAAPPHSGTATFLSGGS